MARRRRGAAKSLLLQLCEVLPPQRQRYHTHPGLLAAQREVERRERILADTRRIAAKWRPKIPAVRKCNFENFKNRFHGLDEKDYAIDVLMGGAALDSHIRREQAIRRREEAARIRQNYTSAYGNVKEQTSHYVRRTEDAEDRARRGEKAETPQTNDTEIQRVRIQSQPVLGHLTSLLNETERMSTPRTFVRPFKSLIYFHPKIKVILATLEEKWADVENLDETSSEKARNATPDEADFVEAVDDKESEEQSKDDNDDDDNDDVASIISVDSKAEDLDGIMDSVEALRDMRCYVNFVDNEIMPLHNQYDGTTAERVKFDDLWHLFRVGDLICMPAAGETAGRYHEMWRIYRVKMPKPEAAYPSYGWEFYMDELQQNKREAFNIYAYYIDHDGNNFGAVRHTFKIAMFPGERLIESLEVFPIRYRYDHQQLLSSLKDQGLQFQNFLTDRHLSYNAWSLTRNPPFDTDDPEHEILQDSNHEEMRHPEFVESDSVHCDSGDDNMRIQHWFPGGRHSLAYGQTELVQTADGVETRQRRENLSVDAFLGQRLKGSARPETQALELRDEDLVLLPKRYALRERRFVPVNTTFLKPIPRQLGVFENLKILKDYKDIVRGLASSARRWSGATWTCRRGAKSGSDPEQGPRLGRSSPRRSGRGKTATAEAVEWSLSNIFRLAHLWDCVLLLDEADRVLEYYNGLTTNRVGTIDEAFKSRIHMSLYYPPLDKTQTRSSTSPSCAPSRPSATGEPRLIIKEDEIIEFAAKHFEDNARSTGCWNGRQIRNAFQITSSLAYHNYTVQTEAARKSGQQPPAAPVLDRSLFEKVQMSTQSFDRHMMDSKGFDSELPLRSTFQQEGRFE